MWNTTPQINPAAVLFAAQVEAAAQALDIQIAVLQQGTELAQTGGATTAELALIAYYYDKEVQS